MASLLRDPSQQLSNSYVSGNPLKWADPLGLGEFGTRPLDGSGGIKVEGEEGGLLDESNKEIVHEEYFYDDDETSAGFDGKGTRTNDDEVNRRNEYEMRGPEYDDDIMREAERRVNERITAGDYNVISCNCQTYTEALRKEYDRIVNGAPPEPAPIPPDSGQIDSGAPKSSCPL